MKQKQVRKQSPSRRVTAQDVATQVGVSVMTVSRAMNNRGNVDAATRKKVLDAARKLGYTPDHVAQSLVLKKTHTIGVVVPEITHSFFPEAIRGIEEVTYRSGYHLILTHSAEDAVRERDALRTLESKRVDGILISTAQTVTDDSVYREAIARGIPVVFFDRVVPGIGAACVSIDDQESARMLTNHLIGHGYRRIAHLSGPSRVSIGRARLEGFRNAMEDHQLDVPSEFVVHAGFHETGGYKAMRILLALPAERRPRAVVAVNDPAAFGAIMAILEAGLRIPDDIAIGGFSDDIRAPLMPVPLTTVRQPAYEVGQQAAQALVDIIEGKPHQHDRVTLEAELVLRRSCGCQPSTGIHRG